MQTDPVDFGEIYMDLSSSDSEKLQGLEHLMEDKGVDAPRFLILNVVPGKPEQDKDLNTPPALKVEKFKSLQDSSMLKTKAKQLLEDQKRYGSPSNNNGLTPL